MENKGDLIFKVEDFVPSLRQAFEKEPLDLTRMLRAAVPVKDPKEERRLIPAGMDRRHVILTDGKASCAWETDSLRALFRGDKQPPVLGDVPEAYTECFAILEVHVLEVSNFYGDRTDAEMKEVYSNLAI